MCNQCNCHLGNQSFLFFINFYKNEIIFCNKVIFIMILIRMSLILLYHKTGICQVFIRKSDKIVKCMVVSIVLFIYFDEKTAFLSNLLCVYEC